MKWSPKTVEDNEGGKLKVFRTDVGYEVWEDFEHGDREWSEKSQKFIGPMKKKKVWMGRTPKGDDHGPYPSRVKAQREIVKV